MITTFVVRWGSDRSHDLTAAQGAASVSGRNSPTMTAKHTLIRALRRSYSLRIGPLGVRKT